MDPRDRQALAEEHLQRGERKQAIAAIDEGLAAAPKDRELLKLKGRVLLELNDVAGALAAYQAFLAAGPREAEKREARKIVDMLSRRLTTFLDVTVTNGPATVYLDLTSRGVFCQARPACKKEASPGEHKVIVERPGFQRWTGRVTVEGGETAALSVTLSEQPSLLTVRVAQPGASVTVDGVAYDQPLAVAPGKHEIVVALAGHAEERISALAREGRPMELEVALARIVPIRLEPPLPDPELLLDGKLVALRDGGVALPAGARELRVSAPGFRAERIELPAERGDDYQLVVRLRRDDPTVLQAVFSGLTLRRKLALTAGGISLAAVAAGAVLGLQAGQLEADAATLCPSPGDPCLDAEVANDLMARGRSRALQANVAFGVAGAAAIGAAVLWLTGAPEARVAVTPRLGAVAGLDLTVRF